VKLGTENKKKTIFAGVLVLLAAVLLVRNFSGGHEENAPAPSNAGTAARAGAKLGHKPARSLMAKSLDPSLQFDLLKSSEDLTYKGTGRNIFRSEAPPPDIPKAVKPDVQPAKANTPPPPPPIDLKFYGFAGPRNGSKSIFLLKGEDIFLAKEGDIVDRRYKIVHVGASSVEIQDVLTNNTQTIPLSTG
jgi:hypothetical protein